jgi:hypothetical protein
MILDLPLSCKYLLFSIDIFCVSLGDIFVIEGDFNLPDINWEEQTIINRQYPIKTNQTFLEIVADNGLEQIVDFPTVSFNYKDVSAVFFFDGAYFFFDLV